MVFFTILKNTLRNCEKSLENAIIYILREYWFKNLPTSSTEINFDFGSSTELVTKPFKLIAEIIVSKVQYKKCRNSSTFEVFK